MKLIQRRFPSVSHKPTICLADATRICGVLILGATMLHVIPSMAEEAKPTYRVPRFLPREFAASGIARPMSFRVGGIVLAEAQLVRDTLVKPHDVLEVRIADTPDISGKYTVSSNGQIELPLVGMMQASGLSEMALALQIADAYRRSGVIYKPHVVVLTLQGQPKKN